MYYLFILGKLSLHNTRWKITPTFLFRIFYLTDSYAMSKQLTEGLRIEKKMKYQWHRQENCLAWQMDNRWWWDWKGLSVLMYCDKFVLSKNIGKVKNSIKLCNFNYKFIFYNYLIVLISYGFNHMIHSFCHYKYFTHVFQTNVLN